MKDGVINTIRICLIIFFLIGCSSSQEDKNSTRTLCSKQEVINLMEKVTNDYIAEQVLPLQGDVIVKTELTTIDDSQAKIVVNISSLPFKDERMPFQHKQVENNGRRILYFYYSDVIEVDDSLIQENLKSKNLIIWISETGKWLVPFDNDHFPNDYISWYFLVCCDNLKYEFIKSSYDLESKDYPLNNCEN